jgi:hypothetical protein
MVVQIDDEIRVELVADRPSARVHRCELLTGVRNKGAEHALLDPPKGKSTTGTFLPSVHAGVAPLAFTD